MTFVHLLFELLILAHVATAFVGLAVFWTPVFARKGGRIHVGAGRIFTYCAYVVTLSAVTASAGRLISFQVPGHQLRRTARPLRFPTIPRLSRNGDVRPRAARYSRRGHA